MPASPFSAATERTPAREWFALFKGAGKGFLADDCQGLAQEIAFNALLAFFPTVILVVGLLGVIGAGAYASLSHLLGTVAPKGVLDMIALAKGSSAHNRAGSAVALALGMLGALWTASGASGAVIKAVNRASELKETRNWFRQKGLALLLVVLTGFAMAAVFVLIVFGQPLGDAIARHAGLGSEFTSVWAILRWPIALAGILLFFSIVYYLAPNRKPRNWRWVTPGSAVGAFLWLAISALFSLYTSFSSSYDRTWGSLAGAIILLLWLNYSALALLFGAELNAELERRATSPGTSP